MDYLKQRWKEMSWGRRIILLLHPALFILSLTLYLTFGQQQVVSYRGGHLRYEQQGDAAVYSGKIEGYKVKYAVSGGSVVEFWLDGTLDSTYTVTEDPTAIPQTGGTAYVPPDYLIGVEIRKDGGVWFRGAYLPGSPFWLLDENGKRDSSGSIVIVGDSAPAPDPAPTPKDILSFTLGPEIFNRGYGQGLLYGLLLSAICLAALLFEDPLFRWQMYFRVRDPYGAEPSEWEMLSRWAGWIITTGVALVAYTLASGLIVVS